MEAEFVFWYLICRNMLSINLKNTELITTNEVSKYAEINFTANYAVMIMTWHSSWIVKMYFQGWGVCDVSMIHCTLTYKTSTNWGPRFIDYPRVRWGTARHISGLRNPNVVFWFNVHFLNIRESNIIMKKSTDFLLLHQQQLWAALGM